MSLAINIHSRRFFGEEERAPTLKRYSTINAVMEPADGICVIELRRTASYSFSPLMLRELLECAQSTSAFGCSDFNARVLVSLRRGVFSLGGDLTFFRDCITEGKRSELEKYAATAVDLIWESITASGIEGMTSFALVQGEAQGGGFEAALAAHVLVAEKGSWFGFPEGLFGLFPGMGARELLAARSKLLDKGKIIGSARRYSAEELYSLGVIDILAEQGRGMDALKEVVRKQKSGIIADFRGRFSSITKASLRETVKEWVEIAMTLPPKHLRTIDYLIKAQERAREKLPTVRVV